MNNTANKSLKTQVKEILLFQDAGEPDTIIFLLDVPSNAPDEPNAQPFFLSWCQEGYGANWLKTAFGLDPDEVITDSSPEESLESLGYKL